MRGTSVSNGLEKRNDRTLVFRCGAAFGLGWRGERRVAGRKQQKEETMDEKKRKRGFTCVIMHRLLSARCFYIISFGFFFPPGYTARIDGSRGVGCWLCAVYDPIALSCTNCDRVRVCFLFFNPLGAMPCFGSLSPVGLFDGGKPPSLYTYIYI